MHRIPHNMTTAGTIALALAGRRAVRLGDGGYVVPCPVPSHGRGRGDRHPERRLRGLHADPLLIAPPDGLGAPPATAYDPLAWYVA